jgi:hypothetical protein
MHEVPMSIRTALCIATVVLSVASCQNPVTPEAAQDIGPAFAAVGQQQTGPSNQCYGAIASGIASTWPWAHNDKVAFPPPPGALALWVETFGPLVGISSVRELQTLFCS